MKKSPLSPHLQIYKPQITSILSITHRLTGIALFFGFIFLSLWILSLVLGDEYFYLFRGLFSCCFAKFFLFGWTWTLFYHLCNGVRHLFWDAGYGFELKTVNWSGWLVVALSLFLTFVAWGWAYGCLNCLGCCHN